MFSLFCQGYKVGFEKINFGNIEKGTAEFFAFFEKIEGQVCVQRIPAPLFLWRNL